MRIWSLGLMMGLCQNENMLSLCRVILNEVKNLFT